MKYVPFLEGKPKGDYQDGNAEVLQNTWFAYGKGDTGWHVFLTPSWFVPNPSFVISVVIERCCHRTDAKLFAHYNAHYSDITWASSYLKSPVTRLFIQQLVQTKSKENIITGPLWEPSVFDGFPHKEPGPCLNIKTVLSTYGDFHVKDKTAVRTSYL